MTRMALALMLVGCGTLDPDVGQLRDAGPDGTVVRPACILVDSDPSTEVTYEQVRDQLFRPRCSCHTIAGGLGQVVAGLDLDTFAAATAGGRNSSQNIIVPGSPCESVIVIKTGDTPPFGAQMPLSGVPLSVGARKLLIDWIADGAKE